MEIEHLVNALTHKLYKLIELQNLIALDQFAGDTVSQDATIYYTNIGSLITLEQYFAIHEKSLVSVLLLGKLR